jgi:glycosyltransferase involved in cell wall biosynthesis
MRIAQLHPYPPELPEHGQMPMLPGGIAQGGSEVSTFRYAYKLAELGHDVTYYAAKYPGITVDELRLNSHFRIVYLKTIFKNVGPAFSFRLFWELLRGKYDVIQSHQIPLNFTLIGAIAAKLIRKPHIITFHGRLPAMFLDSWIGTLASALSTAVTVQNRYAYDLVKGFVPNKKLVIIPHGIDTAIFHKIIPRKELVQRYNPGGHKIILFVGRMIPAKGVDVLLEAYAKVLRKEKNVTLLLCGDGPQRAEYGELAQKLGLQGKAIFAGAVSQADLPHLYAMSSVFVLSTAYHFADGTPIPNVSENFGLVIAEALACETPVVATNIGGIPLWIDDDVTARLFEERNVADLAGKLDAALFDRDRRNQQLIRNGKQLIDNKYSWEAVIRQFEPLFRK